MSEATNIKELTDKLYETMVDGLEGLSDVDQAITAEMLQEYAWLCATCYSLRDSIDHDGAIIKVEKGAANNRRTEMVENPAVKTLARFEGQKSAYYTKLHRVVNIEDVDEDELGAWMKRNG